MGRLGVGRPEVVTEASAEPGQKKPGDWAGHENLFAVTRKGPAQGGKAGSPKG